MLQSMCLLAQPDSVSSEGFDNMESVALCMAADPCAVCHSTCPITLHQAAIQL